MSSAHAARLCRYLGSASLVAAIALVARGHYVTATCGYDCGILGVTFGPAAVAASILGYALLAVALMLLFFALIAGARS